MIAFLPGISERKIQIIFILGIAVAPIPSLLISWP